MPATTPKGYPYPLGTDRVTDGDDSIHNLATAVETLLGVAASGSVVVTVATGTASGSIAVTFPAGRFPAAPMGFACCHGAPVSYYGATGPPATTGMTVYAIKRDGANVSSPTSLTVSWLAIG